MYRLRLGSKHCLPGHCQCGCLPGARSGMGVWANQCRSTDLVALLQVLRVAVKAWLGTASAWHSEWISSWPPCAAECSCLNCLSVLACHVSNILCYCIFLNQGSLHA